jgi:hypothetical protein
MKVKKIEEHINWSDRKGFTYRNDGFEVNWVVISHGDKLLARKTVIDNKNYETAYFYEVARDCADEVEALYEEIVIDFVEICYDNFGMECAEQPFCDFAGPEDRDLYELLSEFDANYNTFLNDVFFQYRAMIEVEEILGDDDYCEHESSMTEEERLAKKVIDRLGNLEAMIKFADGATVQWKIAKAHGELWYRKSATELIGGPYIIMEEDYGHKRMDDVDGISALRDVILADLNNDRTIIVRHVDDEIMKLLNFCEDDFDSE